MRAATKKRVSIVAPVYFEEETIAEFYGRLCTALKDSESRYDFEFIFVNDGSTDRSLEILLEFASSDSRIRIINLARNFGHQRAITAGIDAAAGDAVVLVDSDLQDPPEVIAGMLEKWEEGYHNVYGVRAQRKGESAFKLLTASMFYRFLNRLSEHPIPADTGDFRLLDRKLVDVLVSLREDNRYIRGLIAWSGFRQCPLEYEREARFAGETKYSLKRMIALALDGITSFSEKPLMLSVQLGLAITAASFLAAVYILVGKLLYPESVVAGWTSLLVVVLFVGGVQVLVSGLLGLYVGRIHKQVKQRPLYVVQETFGFPDGNASSRLPGRRKSAPAR